VGFQTLQHRRFFLLGGLATLLQARTVRAQDSASPTSSDRAPFGLTWGMNSDGFDQSDEFGSPDLHINVGGRGTKTLRFFDSALPHVPNDTHTVDLHFGYRNHLFRILVEGKPRKADDATARYREISSHLSHLYGPGIETDMAQGWFWQDNSQKLIRYTLFITDDNSIMLGLGSGYGDDRFWFIDYDHLAGSAEFKEDDKRRNEDQL